MKRYKFHGAFSAKSDADKKAKTVKGTVREIRVNGKPRFTVYTVYHE